MNSTVCYNRNSMYELMTELQESIFFNFLKLDFLLSITVKQG